MPSIVYAESRNVSATVTATGTIRLRTGAEVRVGALSVSGLGVLAIAWIGVRERTREIGTRRTLGATRADIFLQVVCESATLSVLGCAAGLAVAAVASNFLARWVGQPSVFDQPGARLAVAVTTVLKLVFRGDPSAGRV
jgi:putative ABC transport system permease protein